MLFRSGQIGTTPGKGSTSNGYSRDANNVLAVGNGVNGAVIIRHAVANANRTNGATLKVQSGTGVVSIGGNIANLSNLLLDSSSAINLTGAISGTGALSKLNANTLTLTGLANYTGSTEVTAGGIVLTNNVAPATSGFTGTGTVVIEPSTSFTSAVTSAYNFASTLTGLRLGKENNTQSLTISSAIGIAGPVSLYGAGIAINNNIDTRAGGLSGDVLVKSSVDILLAPTKFIKTTGGDVVLWSNSDAQKTDGTILLSNGSSVATGSGHVWLGGGSGSTSWNGLTVGDGYAVPNTNAINSASGALRAGIIFDVSSVQTSGGNIAINAMSGTTTIGAISTHGVNTLDAGNGTIYIKTRNIDNAGRGLLTGMYNSTVAAQTTFKSTHAGSDAIVIDVDVSNGLSTGLGTSVEGNTRILAPNGDIRITSIAATGQSGLRMGYSSTSVGTLQVLSGSGDILLNTGSTSIETANASSTITLGYVSGDTLVPSSVSNIKFVSDKFSSNGALVFKRV